MLAIVMPGFMPGIHALLPASTTENKAWVAGTRLRQPPSPTKEGFGGLRGSPAEACAKAGQARP